MLDFTNIVEKYGFGKNFIVWLKILLRDKELHVISDEMQNISHLGWACVKMTQFQQFY